MDYLNQSKHNNVYIIETLYNPVDFQSRIVECSSWEEYVQIYKDYNGKKSGFYNSTLIGVVLPNNAKISKLKYDDHKLSCDIIHWDETQHRRTAQLVGNNIKFYK